ncbi:MAG: hypothetical protein KGH60_03310 [Candidatus Micrarchaeota archaeon]|nr:hypothetical protein [Candidatus Micrarchaeota archaeon]
MYLTKNELKTLKGLFENQQPADMVKADVPKQIVYPSIKNLYAKGLVTVKLDGTKKVYGLTDLGDIMALVNFNAEEAVNIYKKYMRNDANKS